MQFGCLMDSDSGLMQFVCVSVCVPVFSSISLDLLPERTATLMVYEEVVEIVSGLQGKLNIPVFTFTCSDPGSPRSCN